MEESIFTKIISGHIPCHKIYEDDLTYAFLDIHPISRGHTLVVPKQQVPFVWDLDDVTYQALMASARKIALHLRQTLAVPFIGQQIIGVDVPHAHIHLVPFYVASEFHLIPDMALEPDHKELDHLAKMLHL